jgi:hypothetical protein
MLAGVEGVDDEAQLAPAIVLTNFSAVEHALNDPFRYRFMPRAWKNVNRSTRR